MAPEQPQVARENYAYPDWLVTGCWRLLAVAVELVARLPVIGAQRLVATGR